VRVIHVFLALCCVCGGCTTTPKVVKVLPHFLDREGRIALDPSLFERDAYQAHLRAHPSERNGVQFDVQWRAPATGRLKLLVEMRGSLSNRVTSARLELPLASGGIHSHWSKTSLTSSDYSRLGEMTAWRVTLRNGDEILATQKSFLW
jgi:hypothetical protein